MRVLKEKREGHRLVLQSESMQESYWFSGLLFVAGGDGLVLMSVKVRDRKC